MRGVSPFIVPAALAGALVFGACEKPAPGALIPCERQGKYGYCDGLGRPALPALYDGADSFSEGRAVVLCEGRFGYIDSSGRYIVPPRYRHAFPFRGGAAMVCTDRGFAFIDREGRILDAGGSTLGREASEI